VIFELMSNEVDRRTPASKSQTKWPNALQIFFFPRALPSRMFSNDLIWLPLFLKTIFETHIETHKNIRKEDLIC